jgi:hypothetical protein
VSYAIEWVLGAALLGAVATLWVPGFALIALFVAALATLAGLVALAGVILATPYLLTRSILQGLQARPPAGLAAFRARAVAALTRRSIDGDGNGAAAPEGVGMAGSLRSGRESGNDVD